MTDKTSVIFPLFHVWLRARFRLRVHDSIFNIKYIHTYIHLGLRQVFIKWLINGKKIKATFWKILLVTQLFIWYPFLIFCWYNDMKIYPKLCCRCRALLSGLDTTSTPSPALPLGISWEESWTSVLRCWASSAILLRPAPVNNINNN